MPGKLLEILTGISGSKILDTVRDTVDEFVYSKEEKAESDNKAQERIFENEARRENLDQERFKLELDAYLKEQQIVLEDTKSARSREIAITTNEHSGWLNRNIMPIIASFILFATIGMYLLLIFKRTTIVALDMAVVGGIIDTFKTLSTLIVGYYFGSSLSSRNKDETLKNLTE